MITQTLYIMMSKAIYKQTQAIGQCPCLCAIDIVILVKFENYSNDFVSIFALLHAIIISRGVVPVAHSPTATTDVCMFKPQALNSFRKSILINNQTLI